MINKLTTAVDAYAALMLSLSDAQLDLPWVWGDYDSEGIRFSMFRTFEELRTLAERLAALRRQDGPSWTEPQGILGGYNRAYRRLQVILLARPEVNFQQPPADGEWPLRRVIAHIYGAQMNFFVVVSYALERLRDPDSPAFPPDEFWDEKIGMSEPDYEVFLSGPSESLLAALETLHQRVLADFPGMDPDSLAVLSKYWETELMPLRFRLHRFESHLRQHTIQIEKALVQLGHGPSEARQLLYLVYDGLAQVENAVLGAEALGIDLRDQLAGRIAALTAEIKALLAGSGSKPG